MMNLDVNKIEIFSEILNRRLKLNINLYMHFEDLNEDYNFYKIKKILKNILMKTQNNNIKLRNAQTITFTNAFINYNNEVNMKNKGYYTLKKYCNKTEIRPANLKKY